MNVKDNIRPTYNRINVIVFYELYHMFLDSSCFEIWQMIIFLNDVHAC